MQLSFSDKRWLLAITITIPILTGLYLRFKKKLPQLQHSLSSKVMSEDGEEVKHHAWSTLGLDQALVIAMVGLPARGKSYLVNMITRYLNWIGFECQEFNVGSYRRRIGFASASSDFFDASNSNAQKVREDMAMVVQDEMYKWLHEDGASKRRVAIFDATNTTINRRAHLAHRARKENVFLLFVESICDDEQVLQRNYELKLKNDDYKDIDPATARADFMSRVKAYEKVYEVSWFYALKDFNLLSCFL
jgi:predicted kinase